MPLINQSYRLRFVCLALTLCACDSEVHAPKNCYSPTQNAAAALDEGATGCACEIGAMAQCVVTDENGAVAFFCEAGHWQSGFDGPCETSCAPQKAYFEGSCEPAARYFWTRDGCTEQTGCRCVGADCDAGFADEASCLAAFAECPAPRRCGARAGNTCGADEYCAYQPDEICGLADAESVCAPRPAACDDVLNPVCGCDGQSYANECEANRAGTGVRSLGPCSEQ